MVQNGFTSIFYFWFAEGLSFHGPYDIIWYHSTIRLNTLTCDAKSRSKWEIRVLLKVCGPRINVNRKQKKIKVKDWTFKEHEHNKSFNKRCKIEQELNRVFIILVFLIQLLHLKYLYFISNNYLRRVLILACRENM